MAYAVRLTARAERDLAYIFETVEAWDSGAARRWYTGLKAAIRSLEEHPERCARVAEAPELRQLLYGERPGVYRIIFRVIERTRSVEVLHIRHGARRRDGGGLPDDSG